MVQAPPTVASVVVPMPTPVEPPKPVVQARSGSGCEKYRDLINQYSWNVEVAIQVCNAESSGNPNTSNMNDYHSFAHCHGSYGLFQINCSHGKVFDPATNVRIAAQMWQASKWKPWGATTCKYKVYCH